MGENEAEPEQPNVDRRFDAVLDTSGRPATSPIKWARNAAPGARIR
jgi:hypothetical protein